MNTVDFEQLKDESARAAQLDALQSIEADYSAIDTFLATLTDFMSGDGLALSAERVHTAWCSHILLPPKWTGEAVEAHPPRDQHSALMYLHYLAADLNRYAVDAEARVSRAVACGSVAAADAVAPTVADETGPMAMIHRLDEASRIASQFPSAIQIHGSDLRNEVEATRREVDRWTRERAMLLDRISESEQEVERLRDEDDSNAMMKTAATADDLARASTFRRVRTERMKVEAQAETLRRILSLPLR